MKSREDVIKGLECCIEYDYKCKFCPYADDGGAEDFCYSDGLKTDALALLKEQEPKPPVIKENAYGWKFFYCPSCGREFYADRQHGRVNEAKFCDKCGQAVKWE